MKVTVCFDNVRVVVPCDDGTLLVRGLMEKAIVRYRKATGAPHDSSIAIASLSSLTGGGILDPDDRLCDVADDREQIVAHLAHSPDGASSAGTTSPDGADDAARWRRNSGSTKRMSMLALSTRESSNRPHQHQHLQSHHSHHHPQQQQQQQRQVHYAAQSLPRESRRREPLGQDSPEVREVVIKNEAGPLGLHVVPCYDLLGNDRGLRVEGIEPTGRVAKDGQIDLHDTIVKINGHSLLHIPFGKVQEIFQGCMNEPCLNISVVRGKKDRRGGSLSSIDKQGGSNTANG